MLAIYLTGTGNTKHCVEKLAGLLDENSKILPIENENILDEIKKEEKIILAYPTQFSNCPYMITDFIKSNKEIWKGKKMIILTTMGLFSGDGAGCSARILKKFGANIIGGLQIRMPDSVCDKKHLKKSLDENKKIVEKADEKIERIAEDIKNGRYPKEGLKFHHRLIGLFGQRLWFYNKTTGYSNKLKINSECSGCGACSRSCPMDNIKIMNGMPYAEDKCTMCYRCISHCPKKAITLLGDEIVEQCSFDKYK